MRCKIMKTHTTTTHHVNYPAIQLTVPLRQYIRNLMRLNPRIMFAALLLATSAQATELPATEQQRIANAIYRIEGGAKAKQPYGILSVKVTSEQDARRVCLNTIRNHWKRWQAQGATNYFGDSLGDRYCPAAADPTGNRNWKRNFRKIVGNINPQ